MNKSHTKIGNEQVTHQVPAPLADVPTIQFAPAIVGRGGPRIMLRLAAIVVTILCVGLPRVAAAIECTVPLSSNWSAANDAGTVLAYVDAGRRGDTFGIAMLNQIQEVTQALETTYDQLSGGIETSLQSGEKIDVSSFRTDWAQDTFENCVDRHDQAIKALNFERPDTSPFWPTLADPWDMEANCRAYNKLDNGVKEIDAWILSIDENVNSLQKIIDKYKLAHRASLAIGSGFQEWGESGALGTPGLGLIITSNMLFYSEELPNSIGNLQSKAKMKTREAKSTKSWLEHERRKLDEAAAELWRQSGASICDVTNSEANDSDDGLANELEGLLSDINEQADEQWRDVKKDTSALGESLFSETEQASTDYLREAERIVDQAIEEMMRVAQTAASQSLKQIALKMSQVRGQPSGNSCGTIRNDLSNLDQWQKEAGRTYRDSGFSSVTTAKGKVRKMQIYLKNEGRRLGCF